MSESPNTPAARVSAGAEPGEGLFVALEKVERLERADHSDPSFANPTVSIRQKLKWVVGSYAEWEAENDDDEREEFYHQQALARTEATVAYVEGLELELARLRAPAPTPTESGDDLAARYKAAWDAGSVAGKIEAVRAPAPDADAFKLKLYELCDAELQRGRTETLNYEQLANRAADLVNELTATYAALLRERDAANAKFARHIAAVEEYLVGLFAVIVDPVDDPPTDVEQTMARLLAVATKTRDDLNDLRAKRTADDASIPAAALAPVAISALKERDDLRARLAAAEQDILQLIDGRDGRTSQIERIYHALGGTGEWSSACDLGDEAIELAENSDIAELRSRCAAAEQENAALAARAVDDLIVGFICDAMSSEDELRFVKTFDHGGARSATNSSGRVETVWINAAIGDPDGSGYLDGETWREAVIDWIRRSGTPGTVAQLEAAISPRSTSIPATGAGNG